MFYLEVMRFFVYLQSATRKHVVIAIIVVGKVGDMDEELCDELLDNMDFHYYKVWCWKI